MILLAVATSGDPCSIAVLDDTGLLVERTFRHRMHLSERLVGDVDELLRDAGLELGEVDGFAVDVGPGSFTGVRIGVTTVKTWAELLAKPAAAVSVLDATARSFHGMFADRVAAAIRARPGAAYVAQYDGTTGEALTEPRMVDQSGLIALADAWQGLRVWACGDGWSPFKAALEEAAEKRMAEVAFVPPRPLHAGVFGEIARKQIAAGHWVRGTDLVPLYIAPPPIGTRTREA